MWFMMKLSLLVLTPLMKNDLKYLRKKLYSQTQL